MTVALGQAWQQENVHERTIGQKACAWLTIVGAECASVAPCDDKGATHGFTKK